MYTVVLLSAGTRKNKSGTGVEKLVHYLHAPHVPLQVHVAAIVTNHKSGGVAKRATRLGIPLHVVPSGTSRGVLEQSYQALFSSVPEKTWFVFCGWTQWIGQLFPTERTINVYRGARPGEHGLSYYQAHEADAFHFMESVSGPLASALAVNFVTGPFCDDGPIIVNFPVPIRISKGAAEELFYCHRTKAIKLFALKAFLGG